MTAIRLLRYAALCLLLGIFGCGLPDPARAAEEPGPSASLFAAPFYSCVRNFYVATTGSDANAGTQSSPWLTIQHADNSSRAAGDCINVAPGTYKTDVLITHGGNAPTASGYVAYRCQTLDGCHVLAPGGGPLWGIAQPANFVVVDGFELDGNNALLADGVASVCLLTSGATYGAGNASHHIWALNNIAHHCNLAGIALQNKEWYYAIHNTAYHNAFTSGYQGSGIAYVVVQCIESGNAACASGSTYKGGTGTYTPSGNDTAPFNAAAGVYTPFHNVVAWNHVYDNLISASNPVTCSAHTDGNGIIMDTFFDETTNAIAYPFQTLLSENVAHGNGARGIHIYKASNATVANNTAYGNGIDTCNNSFGLGDLSQAGGSNNVWINNVAQAVVTVANPSCGQFCGHNNIPLIAGNAGSVVDNNNTYLNNVTYGGVGVGPLTHGSTGVGLFNNDLTYFSCNNNKCNTNPLLVNPGAGNFALQAGSPAIGYGKAEAYLPSIAVDAGSCSSTLTNCPQTVAAVTSITSVSPSSGPVAGGTAVTVSGAGFTGATAVTFGKAAGTGMTIVNDGKITVTSPAGTAGTVDIIVTTPAGPSNATTSDAFTYSASLAPPTASAVSATVAYDGTKSAVSLSLGGGAASSVAVAQSPGHGTATASGTAITYTPVAGYFGTDSFTYTASNGSGTSAAATVSIKVSAPTISVSPSSLPGGAVGTAYSQSLTASGGQAPYGFSTSLASGALPGGLSLSGSGVVSGVPTVTGSFTFTVHGTDNSTATPASFTSAQISLTISAATAAPSVSTIIPNTGSSSGGGVVAIIGANFNGVSAVKFGGKAATAVTLVSSTWVSATAPAGTGIVDVTVTTPGGTSAVVAGDKYSYVTFNVVTDQIYSYQGTLGVSGVGGSDDSHFNQPAAGAIDLANGHLFVADTGNHRVQVLDTTSLSVVATIGVAGMSDSDNAHLNAPGGIGYDPATDHVIVADTGNHRVQVFDGRSFAYLLTLGATGVSGADDLHFDEPARIGLNAAAHQLYIADQGNHRVQIYDSGSFAYLATLGTSGVAGSDNAHLSQPRDAEFNPNSGQIMVADSGNSRIQLFDAGSFGYAATLGGAAVPSTADLYFGAPAAIAFDPSSNLVLIADDSADDRVQALDPLTYRYVSTLGTTGSSGIGSNQFAGPASIVPDTAHARILVNDVQNNRVQVFAAAAPVTLASVLPGGRSVELGHSATFYATMINAGATALTDCAITLPATAPAGLLLNYQTTDAATNALTGTPNTPVSIAGNDASQSFLLSFQAAQPLSMSDMPLDFACAGAAPATIAVGVNSIDLAMSSTPTADIIAVTATPTGSGVIAVPTDGSAAFAIATSNAGAAATIAASVDTGAAQLPVSATICQSDPKTGNCVAPPTPSVSLQLAQGDTATFSIFLQSTGPIPFAPASSRVFVRFKDSGGSPHGSTSVAIETL